MNTRSGESVSSQIEKQFDCGWNPEIARKIKATLLSSINLKWGLIWDF